MTQAYPLHWPFGFVRTPQKEYNQFKVSYDTALQNVTMSLRKFAKDSRKDITNLIVSSNVTMMNDSPKDGGVAVYFRWDNIDCCIAIDRYTFPRANLQAIHYVIEAERVKLRHGGLNIVRTAFRGYAALPPPKGPDGQLAAPWWQQLGLPEGATLVDAEARYRELVKVEHPDRGGDAAKFNLATNAIRQAREESRT